MGEPVASEMKVERMKSFFSFAAILFAFVLFALILTQSMHTKKHIYLFIDEYLYMINTLQQYIHYNQLL